MPITDLFNPKTGESHGPRGREPTRYGDWENKIQFQKKLILETVLVRDRGDVARVQASDRSRSTEDGEGFVCTDVVDEEDDVGGDSTIVQRHRRRLTGAGGGLRVRRYWVRPNAIGSGSSVGDGICRKECERGPQRERRREKKRDLKK